MYVHAPSFLFARKKKKERQKSLWFCIKTYKNENFKSMVSSKLWSLNLRQNQTILTKLQFCFQFYSPKLHQIFTHSVKNDGYSNSFIINIYINFILTVNETSRMMKRHVPVPV